MCGARLPLSVHTITSGSAGRTHYVKQILVSHGRASGTFESRRRLTDPSWRLGLWPDDIVEVFFTFYLHRSVATAIVGSNAMQCGAVEHRFADVAPISCDQEISKPGIIVRLFRLTHDCNLLRVIFAALVT